MKPDLSVVVPIRNEERYIGSTLRQLMEQRVGGYNIEFIVVDGMSTDQTTTIVREIESQFPDKIVTLLKNKKLLSSAARNIGVRRFKGKYLLVVDGHVHLPRSDLLVRYIELASTSSEKVIGRPQRLTPPGISTFQRFVAQVRSSKVGHSGESYIYSQEAALVSPLSVAVMYDREIFQDVGLFDEEFDAAEDLEFNYRLEKAGYQCLIHPDLEVLYYPRENLLALFKQMRRYGMGRARFVRKHPERLRVEVFVPMLFAIAMLTIAFASFLSRTALYVGFVAAFVYSLVVVSTNVCLIRKHSFRGLMAVPIALAIHIGLGTGLVEGFLKRTKKKRS